MVWNLNSSFEFSSHSEKDPLECSLRENLSRISTQEIKTLKNKVSLYLEHFRILSSKFKSESLENRVIEVEKLKSLLESELKYRTNQILI